MKRILITGVSGFIGSALAKTVNDKGFVVRGVMRTQSKIIPDFVEQIPIDNISPDTNWAVALDNIDIVIHLAARVHVMQETTDNALAEFRFINTMATINLAKQAANKGVKRFIYLSSIKVNGESTPKNIPFTEENEFVPTDPYALSKHEAEQGLLKLTENTQMEVVIIRPPLVYGPGVKANFLNMMKWLNMRVPLPLGSINNKRSFVGIDNLVNLILTCIDHPAAVNQVFLVSDGEDLSTTELLNRVALSLGKKPKLLPINQQLLELGLKLIGKKNLAQRLCSSLQVDISKTKKLLNWIPSVSVDEGLRKTAQHFIESQSS